MRREFIFAVLQAVAQDPLREALRLDEQGKCQEAERHYQQALAASPSSAVVLNNAGNHYLLCGQPEKAQSYFERLLAVNPAHSNASLQLARIAADRKQGAKALQYLARVKDTSPPVLLLRAEASHWAGQRGAALALLDDLEKAAGGDARVLFTMGMACARMGLYDRAEAAFQAVLVKHPSDFSVLFNLGRAAALARHYDRAQSALEAAVKVRPGDADALVELGRVHAARQDYSRAVYVLAQARQRAPGRPNVLLALARAAEQAGFHGDSELAYDEYLRLQPGDDTARRDRARVLGLTGNRQEEGRKELAGYLKRHPDDPIAWFYLAQFSWEADPEKALGQLSGAVRLNPNFAAARFARAWLLNRLGRTSEALPDFQAAARLTGRNVRALDQLGLAYLTLDRPAEAEKTLREALAVSAEDPEVLMHLGRALMALGREAEAQRYLEAFRKAGPRNARGPRKEPGMIELATLSQGERVQRQIGRLRKDARDHPNDPELQLALASLLLADGGTGEAIAEFRELLARNADGRIWEEAGRSLVRAGQYALAKDFLERAAAARPAARLDLAIATFFADGPRAALRAIGEAPDQEHAGDYLLLKAWILDAAGQRAQADEALREGLRYPASRPEAARQAALLLLHRDRKTEALGVIGQGLKTAPDDAELLLTKAIALGLTGQIAGAEKTLVQIGSRWPEWDRPYLVHGLVLESAGKREAARQKLRTAQALGSRDLAVNCALARLAAAPAPDAQCACLAGLRELVLPGCGKP
ncbi:MAG: tetratricopeptide repeat protein [Acidobacteria bacterium]|nr:tetratricopeptide repeat protein [Acidobacteriota bacterium]